MDENEYKENQNNHNEVNPNSQQVSKVPEYSFWADQVTDQPSATNSPYDIGPKANFREELPRKKKGRAVSFLLKAVCFGLIAGVAFLGILKLYERINPQESSGGNYILGGSELANGSSKEKLNVSSTELGSVVSTSSEDITQTIEDTMPAIVSITSVSTQTDTWFGREYSSEGSGSGIIVERTDTELLITTNNHVVEGTNQITVTFIDGSKINAVIKGTDATADLAVITVDLADIDQKTLDAIKIAKLGDSDSVKVGQMMIAIGNALGYGQSVTVGYVSAKDRTVEISDNYSYKTMILLQTDAAINPGNSGGALLNVKGEVVGINTVKYSSNEVEGMGYAIPISRAIPIINELMSREVLKPEEQGFLGVGTSDVTEEVSKMYNIPMGVFLSEVMNDSAAEKAGLKRGDIITKVNDTEITSRVQLSELISSIRTGTEVEITYMRGMDGGYTEFQVKAVLGVRAN